MPRFAEEIMLLVLDDKGESFLRVPDLSLRCALAAGVLMDLAMEDRFPWVFRSRCHPPVDGGAERVAQPAPPVAREPSQHMKAHQC